MQLEEQYHENMSIFSETQYVRAYAPPVFQTSWHSFGLISIYHQQ